jgi:3-deoxy-D-manno-octulosonic-acid transferase
MKRIWFACYHLLGWLCLPFILFAAGIHLLLKPDSLGPYLHKFAFILPEAVPKIEKRVWIHAVDVGEVISCGPLIEIFENNGFLVFLSTTSRAGFEAAQRRFTKAKNFYFPFDYNFLCKRLLRRIQPDAVLLCEMEIWPAFLSAVKDEGVSLYLISGRLSRSDYRRYRAFRFFFRQVLALFDGLFMQSDPDAERMRALCSHPGIKILGSLKFDVAPEPADSEICSLLPDGMVICAASTHRGDEELVISAFARLRERYPHVKLALIPRHPHRTKAIIRMLGQRNLEYTLRSKNRKCMTPVFLVDTMGELSGVFPGSNLVVMGGSFSRSVGGHNIMEPSLYSKCILCGPHMGNFEDVFLMYQKENAVIVTSRHGLFHDLEALVQDQRRAHQVGLNAFDLVWKNRGAARRNYEEVVQGFKRQGHQR